MRHKLLRHKLPLRVPSLLQFVLCLVLCSLTLCASATAQSGRKQKKADPLPPIQGVNQPEARTVPEAEVTPEAPEKEKEKLKTGVLVMSDMGEIGVPLYFNDTARIACVQELHRQVPALQASDGGQNKTRADALQAAKDSDNVYVVLLELIVDRMGSTSTGLELRFTLYEPKTGKSVLFGTGFPNPPRGVAVPRLACRAISSASNGRDATWRNASLIHSNYGLAIEAALWISTGTGRVRLAIPAAEIANPQVKGPRN